MVEKAVNIQNKLRKAAQAIKKNTALFICSGSGITADSGMPMLRGTRGLWDKFPKFKEEKIFYEDFMQEQFFQQNPTHFWYVYGSLFNKMQRTLPHSGYMELKEIIQIAKPNDNYLIMHEGIDDLYQKAGFDENKMVHIKGQLRDWQCSKCQYLHQENFYLFTLNHKRGTAIKIPTCPKCGLNIRPNIIMKNDVNVIETKQEKQNQVYQEFIQRNDKRSITVLEIGAGPSNPKVRRAAEQHLFNDKYRCALIRINPIKERMSQYNWEEKEIKKLVSEMGDKFDIDTKIPDFTKMDLQTIVKEENEEYNALQNELIEIELGAKEGIAMLKDTLLKV
eukprot:403375937